VYQTVGKASCSYVERIISGSICVTDCSCCLLGLYHYALFALEYRRHVRRWPNSIVVTSDSDTNAPTLASVHLVSRLIVRTQPKAKRSFGNVAPKVEPLHRISYSSKKGGNPSHMSQSPTLAAAIEALCNHFLQFVSSHETNLQMEVR